MSADRPEAPTARYFVDESGDGVLFDSKGRTLLGTPGHQPFFIMGLLQVEEPAALDEDMQSLRERLLADPYFKGVPSMRLEREKTAVAFHAKDDVPEVRREIFAVLVRHKLSFFAVVRDMRAVQSYALERRSRDPHYRYKPNELYDQTTARLFKERLHQHQAVDVCFSLRGSRPRSEALRQALEVARTRFAAQWGRAGEANISITHKPSRAEAGLQAVDYFLWALQRHWVRQESRFLQLLWPQVSLVHAVDETDAAPYGRYYTKKKPLV